MTLLEKMDRLVYATRIDKLLFRKIRPRGFRWTPLLVIAALIIGYALMATPSGIFAPPFWIGWLLFYGAFLAATFVRAYGPRFTASADEPLDERELAIKTRAHALSGTIIATVAMLGCFYMASAGAWWIWHPRTPMDWINLGFGFQAVGILLPTWVASWLEPQPDADDED
ncbi:MAG TPA: hypothetical protein PKD48_09070 [Sphingopyxis sp.]|nr:hypothetical protein [Sphingopyxis sp.]